jgi:hypothetical protein
MCFDFLDFMGYYYVDKSAWNRSCAVSMQNSASNDFYVLTILKKITLDWKSEKMFDDKTDYFPFDCA